MTRLAKLQILNIKNQTNLKQTLSQKEQQESSTEGKMVMSRSDEYKWGDGTKRRWLSGFYTWL